MGKLDHVSRDMKILIVDDFLTMRRIVRTCLQQLGFNKIVEAEDGHAALEILKNGNIQFIVSDWNMPKMMGIDLLRAVRRNSAYRTMPFLMVTAESQRDNVIQAAQAGVSNYIVKPFTTETLEEKMAAIFTK